MTTARMGQRRLPLPALLAMVLAGAAVAGVSGTASAAPRAAAAGTISTVAGGVGGPGQATKVAVGPCGLWSSGGGIDVATVDSSAIRQLSATDNLTTIAGNGLADGPAGFGGPATGATEESCGVSRDGSGNLLIAEQNTYRIAVVAAADGTFYGQKMTKGDIYGVAGNGTSARPTPGAVATKSGLTLPQNVVADPHGNLVIADSGPDGQGSQIDVVAVSTGTFYGQAMTAGHIYVVAGKGTPGVLCNGKPISHLPFGGYLGTVAVDHAGNLVLADRASTCVHVVAASTGMFYGQAMTAGHIYTVAGDGIYGYAGDGGPATQAELESPWDVIVDAAGNLVIADTSNNRIRVVAASAGTFYGQPMKTGDIYTIAGNGAAGYSGNGGPAIKAAINNPSGVAVDNTGNLVIADTVNNRIRVVAERTGTFYGIAMTPGDIYTIGGNGATEFSGLGGSAVKAEIFAPYAVAADSAGNSLIGVTGLNRVFAVAAKTGTFYGIAMKAGHIYTVAGNGETSPPRSGVKATRTSAPPAGLAVDPAGNLVIADPLDYIQVVAASTGTFYGQPMKTGDIYTIAGDGILGSTGDGGPATKAELSSPSDVAVDSSGNVALTEGDNRVRVVADKTGTFYGVAMKAGDIYNVAGTGTRGFSGDGGPANAAELNFPTYAAVDHSGNLVIADNANSRIRVVAGRTGTFYGQAMTTGDIYTVAGDGKVGFTGDGGPATAAEFYSADGVAVDNAGNLVIADTINDRIRVVAERTGTFYGVAMTTGDIYTIAGDGTAGFAGDGGPATKAALDLPQAVAVNSAGNVLTVDPPDLRLRMITVG